LAADAILGRKVPNGIGKAKMFGVKAPQFSFMRVDGADPVVSVEMVSTGEVACFGNSFEEAFLKALIASQLKLPRVGGGVLITTAIKNERILKIAKKLQKFGLKIYATLHTADFLKENGIDAVVLQKVREKGENLIDQITSGNINLVFNVPSANGNVNATVMEDEYIIRRKAVEFGVPVVTNVELMETFVNSLEKYVKNRRFIFSGF